MSKLCRISRVGLYLLLLTHITHSFVLLTANVEDVKKIARKFISDSLAERITNFLAKATENLAKNSEENKPQDSSQVSAENRMYKVEKTVNDRVDNIRKTKEKEATVTPKILNMEKERHKKVEHKTSTRHKKRNTAPKILHGRSRYIEPIERAKSTENNDKNIEKKDISSYPPSAPDAKIKNKNRTKNRFKLLSAFDSNTTTTAATTGIPTVADKPKIDKNSDENPTANTKRSMGAEITAETESDLYETEKEYGTEKTVNEFDQHDNRKNKNTEKPANNYDQQDNRKNKNTEKAANNYDQYANEKNKNTEKPVNNYDQYDNGKNKNTEKPANNYEQYANGKNKNTEKPANNYDQSDNRKNKNTEKAANNYAQYDIERNKNTETEGASAPMSENDETDNEINNIIQGDEKVVTIRSVVNEKEFNDDKWWEKETTTRIQYDTDIQAEGKSWF